MDVDPIFLQECDGLLNRPTEVFIPPSRLLGEATAGRALVAEEARPWVVMAQYCSVNGSACTTQNRMWA